MPASAAGTTNSFRWFADAWRGAVARARKALARADHYDLAAVLLLGALLLLVAFTFRDYAISNDEGVQHHYGELILAYYRSGFADQSHFSRAFLKVVGLTPTAWLHSRT